MTTLASRFQFMESQAAYIESEARMIKYGSIQYPDLVGISREASPHADVITYYSYDGTGTMADIANRATDYPFVETAQQQHNVDIHWKGLAYDWSDREIGRAMLVGLPLADRKVRVSFRIAEEEKERVVLDGDEEQGLGLAHQPFEHPDCELWRRVDDANGRRHQRGNQQPADRCLLRHQPGADCGHAAVAR